LKWLDVDHDYGLISVAEVEQMTKVADELDSCVRPLLVEEHVWKRNGRNCAFITFATPEYALGLKVVVRTLRAHSSYPIIVLTDRRWSFETDRHDVYFICVPGLYNARYSPERSEIRGTLTKLWIFSFLCLDRVVFLDADCLIKKPIDDLFDLQGISCAPDFVENSTSNRFNSGLIAFTPSIELRDKVFGEADSHNSYDHGDQGLLNSILLPIVKFLPPEYNFARHYLFFHGAEAGSDTIRMLHYIVKKPWELWYRETPDVALLSADDEWTRQLTHEELIELVAHWRRAQFVAERPRFESLRQRPHWLQSALSSRRLRYSLAFLIAAASLTVLASAIALLLFAIASLRATI
jgi:hypothetical protein